MLEMTNKATKSAAGTHCGSLQLLLAAVLIHTQAGHFGKH